jgi:hypothetical protein
MFDAEIAGMDATETLTSLASMHDLRTRADLEILRLAQHFADLFPDPATIPGHVSLPGGERGHVYGGPGCPAVAEFAAAEFGAVIGRSAGSAANLMGQALALRHRLPFLWAQVESLNAEPWKACTVATACLALSIEAAAIVDRRVAPIINTVTPRQLENIVKAAVHQADPDAARSAADRRAKERGVWAGHTDEHGTTSLHIRAATGAVVRLKTTLRQIANALADLGDTGTLPERMARAVDIISDPAHTHELLSVGRHLATAASATAASPADAPTDHTGSAEAGATALEVRRKLAAIRRDAYATGIGASGRRPGSTTLYVHITDQTLLDGGGVARVERFGPVFAARLEELLGHGQIVLKPVIDLKKQLNVNAYEIPRELREHLKLIHPVEQFPYGVAETTNSTDLDHLKPYNFTDTGPPGQTSITNLTPLRRYSHRVKTHGRWSVTRLTDGTLEWRTRHGFTFHVDHTGTHPIDP